MGYSPKKYAIIVAGGSGNRMKSQIPKQFLLLNNLPVVMHTINAFYNSSAQPEIILVLNQSYHTYWNELQDKYQFKVPHTVVAGGIQRFDSVKNALQRIDNDCIVAIHDAVRPVVFDDLISRCFSLASEKGSAIPVVHPRDSLRKLQNGITAAINREEVLIVQTPQVFKSDLLKKAYEQGFSVGFTDDASVVEKTGAIIHTLEGDQKNIKITYPEDLEIAALFLTKKKIRRTGFI